MQQRTMRESLIIIFLNEKFLLFLFKKDFWKNHFLLFFEFSQNYNVLRMMLNFLAKLFFYCPKLKKQLNCPNFGQSLFEFCLSEKHCSQRSASSKKCLITPKILFSK